MDICVDTNTDLINQGVTPKLEDFGENQAKLIERHSKYMDTDVLELAYLLAYIGKWKTEEILDIKEKTNIVKISVTEYNNFLEHSFIIKDNNGYYMTNIVRKAFYENIPKELMKEFEKVLYSHAQEKIESKKNSIEIVEETTNYTNRFINHIDEPSEENLKRYDEIRKGIYDLFEKGLYQDAINQFNSFSDYFKTKDDSYIRFKIKADVDQAYIQTFFGNYSQAIQLLLHLQLIIQKVYGELSIENLNILKKLAQNYYENKEYIDAVKFYYESFFISKKIYGENNLETIMAFEDALYHSYKKMGALDFSYEKINVDIEDREKYTWNKYQLDTIDLNDKNGIEVLEKIYNAKLKALGINHEEVIKTNVKLGESLALWYGNHIEELHDYIFHKKNYNKDFAKNYYDCARALKLFLDNCQKNYQVAIKLYGKNDKKTLEAYKNLCEAYVITYDSKGLKKYRKLYKKYLEIYGEYHHKTIEILIKIHTIYFREFNAIKAQKTGKEVYEKCKKVYGEESAITKKAFSEYESIKSASETTAKNHNLGKITSVIAFVFMNFIVKIQYKLIYNITLKKLMKQAKK